MRIFLYIAITLLALTACDRSHDGELDGTYETNLVDIVTYKGLDADEHATFQLVGRDDEPCVNLYSKVSAPDKVKVDGRILLTYTINHRSPDGSSWDIDATGYSRIISDSIRINVNPLDTYSMRPIKLTSIWRTGEFINLHGQAEYSSKSRQMYMMIDADTKYKETVDAYLVHDLLDTPADSIFYWRDFYMSINIGALKSSNSPCRNLRIYINDESNPSTLYREFSIK